MQRLIKGHLILRDGSTSLQGSLQFRSLSIKHQPDGRARAYCSQSMVLFWSTNNAVRSHHDMPVQAQKRGGGIAPHRR